MRRKTVVSTVALFVLGLLVLGSLLILPARHYISSLKATVVRGVEDALQKNVILEIQKVRLGFHRGFGIRLSGISLREKGEEEREILSAESLFVDLDILALAWGEVRVRALYGVRPRIHFVRDVAGRWNVERLFSARYAREHVPEDLEADSLAQTFGPLLWRDRVVFEEGEILYRDEKLGGPEELWFRHLDLRVRNRLESDALSVALSASMVKPFEFGSFSLEGDVKGWKEARRVGELTASVTVQMQDVDMGGLWPPLPGLSEGDEIRGKLKGTLFYEGCLLLPGEGRLDVEVREPFFRLRRVHPKPFAPVRIHLKTGFSADRDLVTCRDGEVDLGGLKIGWGGGVRIAEGRVSFVDLSLDGRDLALAEAVQYIPLGLLGGGVWPFLVNMSKAGKVDVRAQLKGNTEDFSRMDMPQGEGALYLRIAFRDVTVSLPVEETYLPFREVNGLLELKNGTLWFRDFGCRYGKTPVTHIQGSIRNIHQSASFLCVDGQATLDVPEIFRELDHGIFPDAIRTLSRGMSEVSGEGSLGIRFEYDFGSKVEEVLRITGDVNLRDVQARYDDLNTTVKRATGRVQFTESSVSAIQLDMMAGASPVRVEGRVRFSDREQGTEGEIRLISDALVARDLVAVLGGRDELSGVLSCRAGIGWREGSQTWHADLHGKRFHVKTDGRVFYGENLRAKWVGKNGSVQLEDLACRLQGNALFVTGAWTSFDPIIGSMEIRSPSLDLVRLLGRKRDLAPWEKILRRERGRRDETDWMKGCQLDVKLDCERLFYSSLSLRDLSLEGSVQEGQVFIKHARATAGGGGVTLKGQGDLRDEQVPFTFLFALNQVPAQEVFQWFSLTPDILQGPLSVEGNLKGLLRPNGSWVRNLAGRLSLSGGPCTIARYELLGKLLTMINFTQWSRIRLADLNTRGIPCREIDGHFQIEEGVITTDDLMIDSSVAFAGVKGEYDLEEGLLEADLALRPMEQLDQMLDKLPVVGEVIHGPDGTVVEFNYHIAGPLGNPEVELVPMRGLNNRLGDPLKRLNGLLQFLGDRLRPR